MKEGHLEIQAKYNCTATHTHTPTPTHRCTYTHTHTCTSHFLFVILTRKGEDTIIFTLYKASTLPPEDPLEGSKGILGTGAGEGQLLELRVLFVHLHHIVWILLVEGGRRRREEGGGREGKKREGEEQKKKFVCALIMI